MNERTRLKEIPLRIAIVTNNYSYFLPIFLESNCQVHNFKKEQAEKAIETINVYRNQQVFDGVFIEYFPGVDEQVYTLQGINPGLFIWYLHTPFYTEDVKNSVLHPVISSLSELKEALTDIRTFRK